MWRKGIRATLEAAGVVAAYGLVIAALMYPVWSAVYLGR